MSKTIYIGGRLESKEKGNVVTGANAILDDTKGKKQNVINKETDDELLRLEQSKQDNLTFDNAPTEDSTNPVTSGGIYTAEKALSDAIEAILLLIPSAATALNKLVDTNTMNSSISTATATFRGTYNAVSDLGLTYQATHAQIEAALDALGLTADNNDFAFVQIPVSDQSQDIAKTERFKFNGTNWLYEYDLNTSGFTASQWAAINSGITVALVTKLTDLPTAAALQLALNGKQDTLTFDNEPTALSQNPVTSGGIYTAIQAVVTALGGRLDTLEGLIPAEATSANQLADKAYVLSQILAATPAFKGQFETLGELQAVVSPKAGDLGIVRTKDSDGMDVFTIYQYLSNTWNVFCSLSYHPQTKPATTGTTGNYPYNGMGRVELAMNMVNTGTDLEPVMVNQLTQDMFYKGAVGSRVPNTNTIFVIQYDYELAEDITIPAGCVLQFEGGSISNGNIDGNFEVVNNSNNKIFYSITFTGACVHKVFHLNWFVKNRNNTAILSGQVDATAEIQSAFNSGVLNIYIDNDSYLYISSTITVKSYICITGKKQSISHDRSINILPPCIYTDASITMFDIKGESNSITDQNTVKISNLYCKHFGSFTYTDLKSNIPVIKISNGTVGTINIFGVDLDVYILGDEKYINVPTATSGVAYVCGYTGIEICATNGGWITFIKINGIIKLLHRAVYIHKDDNYPSSWVTDVEFNADTNCTLGGDFETAPCRFSGSHQPLLSLSENDKVYFNVSGEGFSSAIVWDLGSTDNGLYNAKYAFYSAGGNFTDVYNDAIVQTLPSIGIPVNKSMLRTQEYIYKLFAHRENILESIFHKLQGEGYLENAADDFEADYAVGVLNYVRLVNGNEQISLSDELVNNFSYLFTITGNRETGAGDSVRRPYNTAYLKRTAPTGYNLYECQFTIKARAFFKSKILCKFPPIVNGVRRLLIEHLNSSSSVIKSETCDFTYNVAYYAGIVQKDIVPESNATSVRITLTSTIVGGDNDGILPSMAILSLASNNVVTAAGGEVAGRINFADVTLRHYDSSLKLVHYKFNKYIGNKYNLTTTYQDLVAFTNLYNGTVDIIYYTHEEGINSIRVTSTGISHNSKNVSVKLLYLTTGTEYSNKRKIKVKANTNTSLYILDVISLRGVKFLTDINDSDLDGSAEIIANNARPTNPLVGDVYFDSSISPARPVWWNGTAWVDATGTSV